MRVVVLALALALVAGDHQNLAPNFAPGNTYVYDYEANIMGGLSEQRLARAGLKLSSKVKISVAQENILLLQLENPQIFEYSDVWPKDSFSRIHLSADLESYLKTPIKFEYKNGTVRHILAPQNVPAQVVNIQKGVINIFQLNIKKKQNIYELQEEGTQGVCKTQYAIVENEHTERILLTKSRNLNHCQEKVIRDIGLAYTKTSHKEDYKSLRGTTGYTYKLKPVPGGALILEAYGNEVIQFTPFNELNGAASMQTKQKLVFSQVESTPIVPVSAEYHSRGSLKYEFSTEVKHNPTRIFDMTDVRKQIPEILNHLVANNRDKVHEDAPIKFLELIELLRFSNIAELRSLLTTHSTSAEKRQWLMDALPYVGTKDAFEVSMEKILRRELSVPEATQILLQSLHQLEAKSENIQEVWNYIERLSQKQETFEQLVRKALYLGYGSMIHRHCADKPECPNQDILRIQTHLEKAIDDENTEELVLLAKVMANAAHPSSIKAITKLLPIYGFSSKKQPSERVQVEAILALRGIAKLRAKEVQNLALQLYMDKTLKPEQRMLAVMVLFETKPSMAAVANVVNVLKYDPSLPVSSFTYSLIKSLSRSMDASVASVSSVALRLLGQRRPSIKLSRALHADYYNHPLMLGAAASIYYINDAASILPKTVVAKTSAFFAGAAADVFEIGVRSEGLHELFQKKELSDDSDRITKMKRILKTLSNWKSMSTSKMLASSYIKVLGQEVAFVDIDKQLIEEAIKLSSEINIKENGMQVLRHLFLNGLSARFVKAMLPSEIRRIMPTAAGLPMELALYTVAVTVADVHAKFQASLPQNFHVSDILSQKTNIETEIKPSIAVNTFAVMGVNTDIAQVAMVSRAKAKINLPSKISASLDFVENNFKISALPVSIPENDAVVADVETLAIAKHAKRMTPLIPEDISSHYSGSSSSHSSHSKQVQDNVQVQDKPITRSRTPRHDKKFCTETMGLRSCLSVSSHNAMFFSDSILNRLIGKHRICLSLHQSEREVVEKWEMELQIGPKGAEKLIKSINLNMEEIPDGTPILSKLKRILTPGLKNYTSSSSSSSSSSSRHRNSRQSSSSSKSHIAGKVISAMGKIMGGKHKSSSSSSSSRSSRHQQRQQRRNKSTVSSLSSLFSASSSSSSSESIHKSQRMSSRAKFQPNHQKKTSKHHSRSHSSGRSLEDIRAQNKFLGDSVPPVFVLIFRAVRANNKPLGYQIAAYEDRQNNRIQIIMAALDSEDNWRFCADAMELSKNKVAAKISWGEKCRTYDTMITAETGLVQNKMAARIRVAWKRLPSSVTKHAKMIYQRILASYLSSVSKQKRSDVTKQISLTAVVESEKLVNVILKSPAAIYKRNVALPVSLPIHSLNDQLPYNDVHNNLHYLLEKTTGPICRFERGQLTTFSNKRYENYMPDSCFQVLAQDCTSSLNFIVLLKKDSSNRYEINAKIGRDWDIDMRYNEERPTVTINGQEIARESLPYNKDSFKIELKNSNKLVLYAKEFGITELNFSNMEVELHILNDYRNRVCGLCGQANGDKRNDLRMPNGNLNDNPVSFVSSWTLPSQSCSDETGCRLRHESVELERVINVHGVESKCESKDPVLRCRRGCTPTKTRMVSVGFHCKPVADSQVSKSHESSIDITESVESHEECSCSSQCA